MKMMPSITVRRLFLKFFHSLVMFGELENSDPSRYSEPLKFFVSDRCLRTLRSYGSLMVRVPLRFQDPLRYLEPHV